MSRSRLTLTELDEVMRALEFPLRQPTLEEAWDRSEIPAQAPALSGGQVLLLVIMRVRPGSGSRFEAAAQQFVLATMALEGALGSDLRRAPHEPLEWYLVERFASRSAFDQHMASDYFRAFQKEQQSLLARPVEALFLEPAG